MVLLTLLLKMGESYGVQLVRQGINRGSVYVTLHRLEKKRLIESRYEVMPAPDGYIGIPRRIYKVTPLGLKWIAALRELDLVPTIGGVVNK